MGPAFSHFRIFGGLAVLLIAPLGLRSEGKAARRSPFLPPANAPGGSAAVTQGAPIELRGIMSTPEGMLFSIYDPAKKSAVWLGLNESGRNYVVRQHQLINGADQVTVEYGGSNLTLSLKAAKILSGPAVTFQPTGPNSQQNPAVTQSVVLNPTPADQAARLQAVAEEVQRRRALRQRTQQQNVTGQQSNGPSTR